MTRRDEDVRAEMVALLPDGWVWPKRQQDTLLAAVLEPMAGELARVEQMAAAMIDELDPRSASLCLIDYERVLGPDPCGRDTAEMALGDRRQLAHQRWTARGGASRQYFIDLAAKRGVTITIDENVATYAGELECDGELIDEPEQFIWTVNLNLLGETLFEVDDGQAGDPLYDLTLADIECDIRRLKPAHTEVAFNYLEEP